MPKSKGRSKKRSTGRGYQLAPSRKKKRKGSPRWYGPAILALMGVGVVMIVLNYIGLVPGGTQPMWLFAGLGLIAVGFIGTMFWY